MRDDDDRNTDVTGVLPLFGATDEPTGRVASLTVRLVCVAGGDLGRTFKITRTPLVIGRGQADVSLRSNDVSRQHAELVATGSGFAIRDLGSQNGTFVNGAAVDDRTPVRVGDRIQIGSTILVFAHHDELEARMHQLQRLEAMGALAGGLAHDFNNALAVILGTLELMERRLQPQSELFDMVGEVKAAAESASMLARRLLTLGRTEAPDLETVLLGAVVRRTISMMRRQLQGIELHVDLPDELAVRCSGEELHQVLVNLLVNARDAMPNGGAVHIAARESSFDRAQAARLHLPAKGTYVELRMTDTGSGMDDATLARVFEPFFTTKPPGQGTGLGLAMVHSTVRKYGGAIDAESALGQGTTFRIWLPRAI